MLKKREKKFGGLRFTKAPVTTTKTYDSGITYNRQKTGDFVGNAINQAAWHHLMPIIEGDTLEYKSTGGCQKRFSTGDEKDGGIRTSAEYWKKGAYYEKKQYAVRAGAEASAREYNAKLLDGVGPQNYGALDAKGRVLSGSTMASLNFAGGQAHARADLVDGSIGFNGTPVKADVSLVGFHTGASISPQKTGASIGWHLVEVNAGVFQFRVGQKYGVTTEYGVIKFHFGC